MMGWTWMEANGWISLWRDVTHPNGLVCVSRILHLDCEANEHDLRLIDHELGFGGRELMSYGAKCLLDSPRFSSIGT